jgi:predicted amidophosphoribosyltransferase
MIEPPRYMYFCPRCGTELTSKFHCYLCETAKKPQLKTALRYRFAGKIKKAKERNWQG